MICVPIIAKNTGEAMETIARANTVADMLELRLDVIESFCLEDMVRETAKPVIVTYRSKGEGEGGYLTFASLEQGRESADGQIPVIQMRDILRVLKG
jgi:3-dehydroquinate dehydratase